MRTAIGKWCGQHPRSREGAPGLHGVVVIVRDDLTAEPPAHCRLVSGHDPFEMVASQLYRATRAERPLSERQGSPAGTGKLAEPAPERTQDAGLLAPLYSFD